MNADLAWVERKRWEIKETFVLLQRLLFVLISLCLWGVSDRSSKVYLNLINIYMHRNSYHRKPHHVFLTHKCNIVIKKTKTNSKVQPARVYEMQECFIWSSVFIIHMSAFQNRFYGTKLKLRIHLHALFAINTCILHNFPFWYSGFSFYAYGLLIGILGEKITILLATWASDERIE